MYMPRSSDKQNGRSLARRSRPCIGRPTFREATCYTGKFQQLSHNRLHGGPARATRCPPFCGRLRPPSPTIDVSSINQLFDPPSTILCQIYPGAHLTRRPSRMDSSSTTPATTPDARSASHSKLGSGETSSVASGSIKQPEMPTTYVLVKPEYPHIRPLPILFDCTFLFLFSFFGPLLTHCF